MTITNEDAKLLETIAHKFSKNVINNYQGDAVKDFMKNLSLWDKAKLVKAKLAAEFNKNAAPSEKAEQALSYCSLVLPAMTKTFSEDFLVAAMPEEARSQHVADLCNRLGQPTLADLCEKAMKATPK